MKKHLVLSKSYDVHADAVEQELSRQGGFVSRVNFDTLHELRPEAMVSNTLENENYFSVYVHMPKVSVPRELFDSADDYNIFKSSWSVWLGWIEASHRSAKWFNAPSFSRLSSNTFSQLSLASSLGFIVPETIFTNSLLKLKEFARDRKIVLKQGNLSLDLGDRRILTEIIDIESIEGDDLNISPCYFQVCIEKQYELRIHVIEDEVIVCRIDSQKSEKNKTDWRNFDLENMAHSEYSLDDKTRKRCAMLVKKLGLRFGIIDAIVTQDNQLVFLECNSQGHWLWIEELTSLPITQTLVKAMTK